MIVAPALLLLFLQQQQQQPVEPIPSALGYGDFARLFLVLGGILVLAWVSLRYGVPRLQGWEQSSHGGLAILERMPLEPKRTLYVVKAGKAAYLIGSSEAGLHFLSAVDPADFPTPPARQSGGPMNFQDVLASWRKKEKSKASEQ